MCHEYTQCTNSDHSEGTSISISIILVLKGKCSTVGRLDSCSSIICNFCKNFCLNFYFYDLRARIWGELFIY